MSKVADSWVKKKYSTFNPIMFASKERTLPEALASRSIMIHLQKLSPDELDQVEGYRSLLMEKQLASLKQRLVVWANTLPKKPLYADMPKMDPRRRDTWRPLRRTIAFAVGVGHSVHIRDAFLEAGVRAGHIDGNTPKDEREAALAQLAAGDITVLTNCMVLTEGWDSPPVGCCVLARPTKSMGLYRQMIGRVLRPADGKTRRDHHRPRRLRVSAWFRRGSRRVDP